jgi:polyisoprenyl-teichoic acid--peptidoglycan teichoic acid transferase
VWLRFFVGFFLVIILVGGAYSSYLVYAAVREFVAYTEMPALPAFRLLSSRSEGVTFEGSDLSQLPEMPVMTPVAGAGELAYVPPPSPAPTSNRVNVLLLGIDRRGGTSWGHFTDTIIIVSVDPVEKTVGMMSIPRDLQVSIPGNGDDRINTANPTGYRIGYPGGGPALLKRTIETNFEISIDYYIMIDFRAFVEIVDTLGGIDINVARTLHDTMYPDPRAGDPYAYKTVHFDPGWQHMAGARALEFARSRMSTTDFDRAKRQQQILIAIRDKAMNLNLLPKLPTLAKTMAANVETDMSIEQMVELARLAPQIGADRISQVVIEKPMVYGYKRDDGAAVQLPKWDLIRPVVAELFDTPAAPAPMPTPAAPTPTPTLAPIQVEELRELAQEGARVAIQNGTSEPNYAARVAALLMQQGYQVVEFGDADRLDYPRTVIVDYGGKSYTLQRLVDQFQVSPENVRHSPDLRSQVDIRVIVGQDSLQWVP